MSFENEFLLQMKCKLIIRLYTQLVSPPSAAFLMCTSWIFKYISLQLCIDLID